MAAIDRSSNTNRVPKINPNAGMQVIGSTPMQRNTGPGLASKPPVGAKTNNYDMTVVGGPMPSNPIKPSAPVKKNPNAGMKVIGSTPMQRNTGPGLASKPPVGAKTNNYDMTVVG
jgi:hypothetical protein